MTVWSDDPKQGFLIPDGIKTMRSTLTNSIFQDDRYSLYQRKYVSYKLYLSGKAVQKDSAKALEHHTDAAGKGNVQAQYVMGKLYLLGQEVESDEVAAVQWLTAAANQGHEYAQIFRYHKEPSRDPSALLCATRLLISMAQIIRDTPPPAPSTGR